MAISKSLDYTGSTALAIKFHMLEESKISFFKVIIRFSEKGQNKGQYHEEPKCSSTHGRSLLQRLAAPDGLTMAKVGVVATPSYRG